LDLESPPPPPVLEKGDGSHVVIALCGQIKGEHHKRCHLLPLVLVTQSGVKVAEALEHLTIFLYGDKWTRVHVIG
jgi:hypothetical protein